MTLKSLKYVIAFFIIFNSVNLLADTYMLNGNYYVRCSPRFGDQNNKVGVLLKGSTFAVVQTKTFSNGAEALQISIKDLSRNQNGASQVLPPSEHRRLCDNDDYWIYKPNNTDFIKTRSSPATQADVNQPCNNCSTPAQPSPDATEQNKADIADVSRTIVGQQNQPQPAEGVVADPPAKPISAAERGSLDAKIKAYSNSDEVKNAINYAMRNKYSKSQGTCYRSVKKALVAKVKGKPGLIPYHYSDLAALGAKKNLKKFGFVNLLDQEPYKSQIGTSPSKAPKGAVLVYSSGIPCGEGKERVADCGHVEIKTNEIGKPGYVSDYYSDDAINETPRARARGTGYKLVGVMVKP